MVRVEVTEAVQVLVEAAEWYRRAYRGWEGAVAQQDQSVAAAERRVMTATGGLGYRRWELACSRRRIYTKDEALMVARAVRAWPAVASAVAKLEQVRKGGDAAVLAARVELAGATKVLSGYGQLGAQLSWVERLRASTPCPALSRPFSQSQLTARSQGVHPGGAAILFVRLDRRHPSL